MERNNESENVIMTYLRAFAMIGRYLMNTFWNTNEQLDNTSTPNHSHILDTPNAPNRQHSVSRVEAGLGEGCVRVLDEEFGVVDTTAPVCPNAPVRPSAVSRVEAGLGGRCVRNLNQTFEQEVSM